jgi:hypothetical protein
MSAANDGPGKGAAPSEGAQGKKPSALLDLKATELKGGADKSSAEGQAKSGETGPAASGKSAPAQPAPTAEGGKSEAAKPAGPPSAKSSSSTTPRSSDGGGNAPPKPARGSGLGSVLTHTVAGLVGGLLALLAADTVGPQLGLGNGLSRKDATDALQKRLGDIEQRMAAGRSADPAVARQISTAEKRIADLEATQQRLAAVEAQNAKLADEAKALRETISKIQPSEDPRLTKLQDQLATLAAAAGTDPERGRIPQLAAITGKMADLEATIANQLGQVRRTLGQEIDQRLAPVAEGSEAARSGTQRIDRELAQVKSETVRLAERIETNKTASDRLDETVRALDQQVAQIKTALEAQKTALASELKGVSRPADVTSALAPVTAKLGQIETNLKEVVKSEQDRRSSAEQIVLSLELGNLRRAVDRGGSYATELAEVQKIAGGRLNLAPLAKFKDAGVPTTVELVAEFRPVANAILDAEATAGDASVVDRLLSGAKSVVRVRKVNYDPNDKSADAVVGRMDAALKDGRLGAVLEEAKSLGDRGQAAAKPWLDKVSARHAVDMAIAEVDKQLKTTIGGVPAPAKGVN